MIDDTALEQTLQERFHFSQFRPGQKEALHALLDGGRLICIQPTGHGKSLLYQLPTVLLPGMTLVISPLLALMRDQIGQLRERFDIPAAAINSDQSPEENDQVFDEVQEGRVKILFVAPEQLDKLDTFAFLTTLPVDLLVVDEAHCISTWGHDFRPAYRQILNAVHRLEEVRPSLRLLGLTATADGRTEEDIVAQFRGVADVAPQVQRHSMDRPNIALTAIGVQGVDEKLAILDRLMDELEGCGILYCATRDQTEIVAGYLCSSGHDVIAYHAGLHPDRKRQIQERFTRGGTGVIAATNALGMGIDKPDIRFIVHVDVPGSITAYYQEVGRAGRDGDPARGILLYDERDREVQDYFIRSAQPTVEEFERVLAITAEEIGDRPPARMEVGVRSGLHPTKVIVILAELVEQGFVEKVTVARKQVYRHTGQSGVPDLSRYDRQLQVRTRELESILEYGRGDVSCLMQALRVALGDDEAPACGRCSRCAPDAEAIEIDEAERAAARSWIVHRDVLIAGSRYPLISPGLALLDGEVRSPLFVTFMRERAERPQLDEKVLALCEEKLGRLIEERGIGGVVMVPSRSWAQRESLAAWITDRFGLPVWSDLVDWDSLPEARQGELLNNDQRRHNVQGRMGPRGGGLPEEPLLLIDDYIGSGATLKEAARVLRKAIGFEADLVPFAFARVRWRLGAAGMI